SAQSGARTSQPTILLTIEAFIGAASGPGPYAGGRTLGAVEALADFLAGLELRHVFLAHIDLFAGARITPDARRTILHRKGAKAPEFDPVAPRHRIPDFVEDRIDDILDVTLEQMRVFRGELLDKFGLDHQRLRYPPLVPMSGGLSNLPKRDQTVKHHNAFAGEAQAAHGTADQEVEPVKAARFERPGRDHGGIGGNIVLAFKPLARFGLAADRVDQPRFDADPAGDDAAVGQSKHLRPGQAAALGHDIDEPGETVFNQFGNRGARRALQRLVIIGFGLERAGCDLVEIDADGF